MFVDSTPTSFPGLEYRERGLSCDRHVVCDMSFGNITMLADSRFLGRTRAEEWACAVRSVPSHCTSSLVTNYLVILRSLRFTLLFLELSNFSENERHLGL